MSSLTPTRAQRIHDLRYRGWPFRPKQPHPSQGLRKLGELLDGDTYNPSLGPFTDERTFDDVETDRHVIIGALYIRKLLDHAASR